MLIDEGKIVEIKNAIIHNVRKELKCDATIEYSKETLNLRDEKCLSLFAIWV